MSQKLVINSSDRLFPVFLPWSYILSKEICLKIYRFTVIQHAGTVDLKSLLVKRL